MTQRTVFVCVPPEVEKVLCRIFPDPVESTCRCHPISMDSLLQGPAGQRADADGVICLWAEDLRRRGSDSIISFLTRLRTSKENAGHGWPVLVIGYSSHLTFLRSMKVPRILAAPGIEYFQLPGSLSELRKILEELRIPDERLIREYFQDHDRERRLGDQLAHDLGNFYAMFRLLDGAFLKRRVSKEKYSKTRKAIQGEQEKHLKNHVAYQEFLSLRGMVPLAVDEGEKPDLPKLLAQDAGILLIDDAATLGWAHVLACLLGRKGEPKPQRQERLTILRWQNFMAIGRTNPLDPLGEDSFVTDLMKIHAKQWEKHLQGIDIVFLDLRLRRKKDEEVLPEVCSGVQVLEKIREINAGIQIVLLTASRKVRSLEAVMDRGADNYFIKDSGIGGEKPEALREYYESFEQTFKDSLGKIYLKAIWDGIDKIGESGVDNEVVEDLYQAFALMRKRPTAFEMKLCYSPFAASIVSLGSAMERYINADPISYEEAVCRFFRGDSYRVTFALHLGFLRNVSAHGQSAGEITEPDSRISFAFALACICHQNIHLPVVLGVEGSNLKLERIVRRLFSVLRKRVNTGSQRRPPKFCKIGDLKDICKKDLVRSYVSFLFQPTFRPFLWDSCRSPIFTNCAAAALARLEELLKNRIEDSCFEPAYDGEEREHLRIVEAFWNRERSMWEFPGSGKAIPSPKTYSFDWLKKRLGVCTQAFWVNEQGQYESWGPPLPLGYPEESLRSMLSL